MPIPSAGVPGPSPAAASSAPTPTTPLPATAPTPKATQGTGRTGTGGVGPAATRKTATQLPAAAGPRPAKPKPSKVANTLGFSKTKARQQYTTGRDRALAAADHGGGLLLGLVGYAMAVSYIDGGWSGVGDWLKAKFLNEPTQKNAKK